MKYTEFQHLARLFAAGALDHDELETFTTGRMLFGKRAEAYLSECRLLAVALALSLRPMEPQPGTKTRLMQQIRQQIAPDRGGRCPRSKPTAQEQPDAFEAPLSYEASYRN